MVPTSLAYTLGAFLLILLLSRFKVPLAVAILSGALAVGLLFKLPPLEILRAFGAGAIHPMTIGLIVIIVILLTLSETMRRTGQLEEIVTVVRALMRRPAFAMAALPAIIGLLPMPGGALFSAPMVKSAAGKVEAAGGTMSAVNYWFRHLWEYWWPLYPGVILAVSVVGDINSSIGMGRFIAFNLPLSVFTLAGGLWVLRGLHRDLYETLPPPPRGSKRKLLRVSASIWGVLIIWIAMTVAMRLLFGPPPGRQHNGLPLSDAQQLLVVVHRFVPLALGLIGSLIWTMRRNRLSRREAAKILASGSIYKLAALALSVMVFQYVLKDVGAAKGIGEELRALHVPIEVVVAILPFVAGIVTGLAVGFVGTSFPIVLGLVAPGAIQPYVVLAYACGHMGQMMSPLHLCHIVSNRYFETSFSPVYRRIIPAGLITIVLAIGYFLLLRWLLG